MARCQRARAGAVRPEGRGSGSRRAPHHHGGQAGSYDDADRAPWAITDWRTGAVLTSGCDDYEGYAAAVAKADPDNCWILVDNFSEQTGLPEVDPIPGLPDSLAEALQEWVESKAAPLEVAAWINERWKTSSPV